MKRPWTMPKWMLPFKKFINNTGGNPIEELVNDDGTNSNVFNNAPRALICCAVKCQVNLLESLHRKGLLEVKEGLPWWQRDHHDDISRRIDALINSIEGDD